ncbi:MAG TPA: 4-alpha-glucanotransferase [Acidimicrobiales bacterium]|nr:4-alpha-glucanotransferase [Acidimicrobiales bacterium]
MAILRALGHPVARPDDAVVALAASEPRRRRRQYMPDDKTFGIFAPVYAIREDDGVPRSNLLGLADLAVWAGRHGAAYLSTLPLLAKDFDVASPYSPLSRMWWDEGLLPLDRYPRRPTGAADDLRRERPDVDRYGAYRHARAGTLDPSLWAEMQATTDVVLGEVVQVAERAGCGLMLDMPVGCVADGYDPWAHPDSFVEPGSVTIGAPPDEFFTEGQDWGLLPLHPQRERVLGYPVVRACLRHCMRHAKAIRIDHVMGMRRLWWVPDGFPASEGAYVRYPTDELLDLALEEAGRQDVLLVGEDLGTVEPALRTSLRRRGILGTDAAIFGLGAGKGPFRPRAASVAMVGTHDTATFGGWWETATPADREALGANDPVAAVATLLERLGESEAAIVMVTLEDLWGETRPQNVPGTVGPGNFSRPFALTMSKIAGSAEVASALSRLQRARARATVKG